MNESSSALQYRMISYFVIRPLSPVYIERLLKLLRKPIRTSNAPVVWEASTEQPRLGRDQISAEGPTYAAPRHRPRRQIGAIYTPIRQAEGLSRPADPGPPAESAPEPAPPLPNRPPHPPSLLLRAACGTNPIRLQPRPGP
ncbi:hypothetical protein SBA4_1540019 [Candidatus Sulfopaludibacter sp. SbA4]|nr:hypothetical protein SBA4_1540019 [Candidatus Sulfopaludibacter sp. SbA4]